VFRSLAAKLIVIGLIQLVLVALTATIILVVEGSPHPPVPFQVIAPNVMQHLESLASDPVSLQKELNHLATKRVEVTIYDADFKVVASSAEPPIPIPPHRQRQPLVGDDAGRPGPPGPAPGPSRRRGPPAAVRDFKVGDGLGLIVAAGLPRKGITVAPVFVLAAGFFILVVGALLTARWIVRPINQLSEMAQEISEGNLSRRVDLRRNDEIGELGNRVNEMLERIEQLMASERELLANVAHELRTPLARIGVAVDLANEGDATIARSSLAEIAVDAAELVTLIEDIFLAARLEQAKGEIPMKRVSMRPVDIVDAAVQRMTARKPERQLNVSVDEHLPPINVDPVLFRRVIDNLLENAHKYTAEIEKPIAVSARLSGHAVVFAVTDNGAGISQQDLPFVFTAFYRGDKSRARNTGGVGLGLTLAKRIADAHHATIEVVSKSGEGSVFSVAVPVVS
jgi:two-component system, OmpR family, sensor kinase